MMPKDTGRKDETRAKVDATLSLIEKKIKRQWEKAGMFSI